MKILSIISSLLFNILLMTKTIHCKTLRAKLNDSTRLTESVTNVSEVSMPVEPLVLQYLADHMSSQECFQFYNYLVSSQHQNKMTFNRTWSYEGYVSHDPTMKKGGGKEFPCYSSLKQWSSSVLSLAKSELDKRIYAETFLLVALHKINRRDLHSWMDKVIRSVQHDKIEHFEKELHLLHAAISKRKPKRKHNFEEEEARSVMILGFICFVFVVGLSAVVLTYICISVRLKTRDYIPLNSKDGSTNQGKKWGNESSRGYYSFVPAYEVV